MDGAGFVELVGSRHPTLAAAEPDAFDDAPSATLVAGALARHTRQAVDHGDRDLVAECFTTALVGWDDGDDRVQNAIGVSYLAHLSFADGRVARAWAWDLLPPRLQAQARSLGLEP